jgi:hypothetical protein
MPVGEGFITVIRPVSAAFKSVVGCPLLSNKAKVVGSALLIW